MDVDDLRPASLTNEEPTKIISLLALDFTHYSLMFLAACLLMIIGGAVYDMLAKGDKPAKKPKPATKPKEKKAKKEKKPKKKKEKKKKGKQGKDEEAVEEPATDEDAPNEE